MLVRTSRLSESILVTVHCREGSARIPRDVATDFRKVPADCARVWRIRGWEIERVAVQVLLGWVSSWRGCVMTLAAVPCLAVSVRIWKVWLRALIAVHSLAVDANTLRDCPTIFRKVPTDWVRVRTERVWEANLVGVHCLEA